MGLFKVSRPQSLRRHVVAASSEIRYRCRNVKDVIVEFGVPLTNVTSQLLQGYREALLRGSTVFLARAEWTVEGLTITAGPSGHLDARVVLLSTGRVDPDVLRIGIRESWPAKERGAYLTVSGENILTEITSKVGKSLQHRQRREHPTTPRLKEDTINIAKLARKPSVQAPQEQTYTRVAAALPTVRCKQVQSMHPVLEAAFEYLGVERSSGIDWATLQETFYPPTSTNFSPCFGGGLWRPRGPRLSIDDIIANGW